MTTEEAVERLSDVPDHRWHLDPTDAKALRTVISALEAAQRQLGDLLAVIHRDGGHYQAEHGTEKAVADALRILPERGQLAEAGQAFKAFVHAYLDSHGVAHGDPENQHQKEGCRIGARLDLLFAQRDAAMADAAALQEALKRYGGHVWPCSHYVSDGAEPCVCGFKNALLASTGDAALLERVKRLEAVAEAARAAVANRIHVADLAISLRRLDEAEGGPAT